MNIKDLFKSDLKSLDFTRVLAYISFHADELLRFGVVVLTVWGILHVSDDYLRQTKVSSAKIGEMNEKLSQVMQYQKSVSSLKLFWEKAPKLINDDMMINYVTDTASKNRVEILSFTPGQKSNDKFHEINKVKFKLKAKDYKDLVLFVRSVESSEFALRVESMNCALESVSDENNVSTLINVQMEVSSVKLNERKDI